MYFWVKPEIKLGGGLNLSIGSWAWEVWISRQNGAKRGGSISSLNSVVSVVWQAYIALDLNSAIFVFMEIKDVLNQTPDSWTPYDYSLWSHVVREEGLKKWVVWHYLKKKLFQRQRKLLHNSGFITMRSHRRRREHQSGRKSFIFNVSRRRAAASSGVARHDESWTMRASRRVEIRSTLW